MLAVLGTLALVGCGLALSVVGLARRRRTWARAGTVIAATAVVGWATLWIAGWMSAPRGMLPMGEEVSFCGLDCHLHVSVVGVSRDRSLTLSVRFRSDAKAVTEFPGELRLEVRDGEGRSYLPTSGILAEPLRAGETLVREFTFAVPDDASSPRLIASYQGWLDYLVPGQGNPLVQRRIGLAI